MVPRPSFSDERGPEMARDYVEIHRTANGYVVAPSNVSDKSLSYSVVKGGYGTSAASDKLFQAVEAIFAKMDEPEEEVAP